MPSPAKICEAKRRWRLNTMANGEIRPLYPCLVVSQISLTFADCKSTSTWRGRPGIRFGSSARVLVRALLSDVDSSRKLSHRVKPFITLMVALNSQHHPRCALPPSIAVRAPRLSPSIARPSALPPLHHSSSKSTHHRRGDGSLR